MHTMIYRHTFKAAWYAKMKKEAQKHTETWRKRMRRAAARNQSLALASNKRRGIRVEP